MPFHALDVPAMASEDALHASLLEIPNTDARIIAGGCKTTVIRTEADSTNRLPGVGSLPCSQVVHVGLEIFDCTGLICRG